MAQFAAYLREHGLTVGPAEQQAMLKSLTSLGYTKAQPVSDAWRSIACGNAREWRMWPQVFEQFWFPHQVKGQVKVSGLNRARHDLRSMVEALQTSQGESGNQPPSTAAQHASADANASDDAAPLQKAQGGASAVDALDDRSHQMWMPDDLHRLQRLAQQIFRQLQPRSTRRWAADPRGHRLDIRQTFRNSLSWGGLPLQPAWSSRKTLPARLFILADVSRSMETHAAFYLRLCKAFVQNAQARAFVFHVRLAEITPLLWRDSPHVQEKINAVTAGFGSGTRIASNLMAMARSHARAQLRRPCHVWVLSDGFDTDPPEELQRALQQLKSHGARITWMYPNAQRPHSQAISQAKACIDQFIPLSHLGDLLRAQRQLH